MRDLRTRSTEPELMDTVLLPAHVIRRALRFLDVTNRYFGGLAVVRSKLDAWSGAWNGCPITLLDVGTGGADIPIALVGWARSRRVSLRVTAIDSTPAVADLARERAASHPEITVLTADLFDLAHGEAQYDYVTASLFLHHVHPAQTLDALRALHRLARRGVIVSDLRRTWPSYLAVSLAAGLGGNRVVRHDGPASVRRAFRVEELRGLAAAAHLPYLVARSEPGFRVSLAGEKADVR
jgi:2-polyprenyl-3-methyl-5-hydroxy-6-metoxy-1,4-benzoquinol methylase